MSVTRIRRNPRTAWRVYEDATLVITPDDRTIHELNETGTAIWLEIGDDGATGDALSEKLCEEYDVSREIAVEQVEKFVHDASRKKILTIDRE